MFTGRNFVALAFALAALPALRGAESDKSAAAAMTILRAQCFNCHNDTKVKGGLDLTSRAAALKGGDSGVSLKPGKGADSLLIKVLAPGGDPHMPPKKQLPAPAIATLRAWVDAGAPWDAGVLKLLTRETKPDELKALPASYTPVLAVALAPDWPAGLLHYHPADAVHDYWGYYVTTRSLLSMALGEGRLTDVLYGAAAAAGVCALLVLWWRTTVTPLYPAAITLAATPLLAPIFNTYDYVVLILPLVLAFVVLTRRAAPAAPRGAAALGVLAWFATSADRWLRRLIEPDPVWTAAQRVLGEEGTNRLWTDLRWDSRFLALLLPAALLVVLIVRRQDVVAMLEGAPAAPASSEAH